MAHVTGIGGIFFKARDADALRAWYRANFGLEIQEWGGAVFRAPAEGVRQAITVWTIFPESSTYFNPSPAPFMINYRVTNLAEMLAELRAKGCTVEERVEESEFGKFGWVHDPEGNRVELWEPPSGQFPA
jgi:predicted enzyme related to lactoylglutathione lyase